ncbi:MAG: universal stress protein [Halolamina sp.]
MYDDILVPTDGSPAVDRAVDHAVDLAQRHDAQVHALYIVDSSAFSSLEGGTDAIIEALEEEGHAAVEAVTDAAENAGLDATSTVRTGTPHTSILEYVEEAAVDAVVMGTHGRTGLDRMLLGSVAEKVVRHAEVPVMTVHADGSES